MAMCSGRRSHSSASLRYIETCTAMAEGILRRSRDSRTGHDRQQAENVVGENIHREQIPVPLLEVSHGLKRVAREGCVRSAEADGDEQSPLRVCQHSLRSPDEEEPEQQGSR